MKSDTRLAEFINLARSYRLKTYISNERLIILKYHNKELQIDLHKNTILIAYVKRRLGGIPYQWVQIYKGSSVEDAVDIANKFIRTKFHIVPLITEYRQTFIKKEVV